MTRLMRLRESLWFVPGLMVIGAIVAAQVVVAVDSWLDGLTGQVLPDSLVLGVEGSRGILVAIAGSVLAVAGTTFSITMSVIATASSTYGPRLVRNFMADRSNQRVLGLFVATFVYCLLVLRRVTDDPAGGGGSVPHLAVYLAIVLALLNVAALVYFLHHIADIIQVATLVRRVRGELEAVVRTLYGVEETARHVPASALREPVADVLAGEAGFVTHVDESALVRAASRHDGVVELVATPGTHVLVGEPLALVGGDAEPLTDAVRRHVRIGDTRTPAHDVLFAVQQLVEMAVRAVSPSMNDPYTAQNAIEELASGLVPALRNPEPDAGRVDDDGRLRLVWRPPSGHELIDAVYDDLRVYAASDPRVVRAGLGLARRLLLVAPEAPARRVHDQLDELLAAAERAGMADFDLDRLRDERAALQR